MLREESQFYRCLDPLMYVVFGNVDDSFMNFKRLVRLNNETASYELRNVHAMNTNIFRIHILTILDIMCK